MTRPPMLLTLILAGAIAGCSTTQPDDPGEPLVLQEPAPPPPATDPRVSELQVLVTELLDRIEVLNARLARLESGPAAAGPTRTVSAPAVTPASPAPREAVKPIPTLA